MLHDFCSRGHAQLAKARGEWPRPASKGTSTCSLPGCDHLVFRDSETGKVCHCRFSVSVGCAISELKYTKYTLSHIKRQEISELRDLLVSALISHLLPSL